MNPMSDSVTASSPGVPVGHPAHILLDPDDVHEYPHLNIEIVSGNRPEAIPGIRYWYATATVQDHAETPLNIPVAHMSITLVNEDLCDPVDALDAIDSDSLILGDSLWVGGERRPEFDDIAHDNWGPVAIVNSYEVVPAWRGTPLSPMIALRMLHVFAELDVSTAALYAAPYNSNIKGAARDTARAKIAAMWARAGFTRLHPDADDAAEFSRVMARTLDPTEIDDHLEALAGDDPALREALDL